jgi:hypothetical protein
MRSGGRGAIYALVAAAGLLAAFGAAACGGDSDADPVAYVDDRLAGAKTAPAQPSADGTYDDPLAEYTPGAQGEEVVRDFQEALAERDADTACDELWAPVMRRLEREGRECFHRVSEALESGRVYEPSKILAVDLRAGGKKALVTVQAGDQEPFAVPVLADAAGFWVLADFDLSSPTGLRPVGSGPR